MRFDITDVPVQVAHDESRYSIGIKLPKISFTSFSDTVTKTFDDRPDAVIAASLAPMTAADTDWGEQDSLANIPRTKTPGWITVLQMDGDE